MGYEWASVGLHDMTASGRSSSLKPGVWHFCFCDVATVGGGKSILGSMTNSSVAKELFLAMILMLFPMYSLGIFFSSAISFRGPHLQVQMLHSLWERLRTPKSWLQILSLSASCSVSVKKATVIFEGERVKIQEKFKNGMLHGQKVSFFCKNKEKKCSYTEDAECIDGTLEIPKCFKGKSNTGTSSQDFHLPFTIITTLLHNDHKEPRQYGNWTFKKRWGQEQQWDDTVGALGFLTCITIFLSNSFP